MINKNIKFMSDIEHINKKLRINTAAITISLTYILTEIIRCDFTETGIMKSLLCILIQIFPLTLNYTLYKHNQKKLRTRIKYEYNKEDFTLQDYLNL